MIFQLKHYVLPHDGVMPGARGYKKVIVPRGTKVYCIVYGTVMYSCVYLHEADAMKCMQGLQDTVSGRARKTIPLDVLVDWNFQYAIPKRVFRSAEYRK